jgi:diguanylate cyclase (GGDEF)-like protein
VRTSPTSILAALTTTTRPACAAARAALGTLLLGLTAAASALDPERPLADQVQNQWGLAEGLPQVSVHAVAQDADGYLWIGTQNGIARFDGYRGVSFRRQNNGGHSLTAVFDVHADRDGTLWFATDRGLVRQAGGVFASVPNREVPANVTAIAEDDDGHILAATATGVQRVTDGGLAPHLLQGELAASLLQVPDGPLWVGVRGALVRFDGDRVARLPLAGDGSAVARTLALREGRVWIGTTVDLQSVAADAGPGTVAETGPVTDPVTSLLADREGSLWIGTRAALNRISRDGTLSSSDASLLPTPPWIESLFEDAEGNLWIGSRIHGLFRVWDGWIQRLPVHTPDHDGVLWSVALAPDGRLVTGTHDGLLRQEGRALVPWIDGSLLPEPTAYEIAFDSRGRLWIGTRGGIALLDPGAGTPVTLPGTAGRQYAAIVEADDGSMWLGSSRGVQRWKDAQVVAQGPQGDRVDQHVRGILPIDTDSALLATEAGVRRLDGDVVSTPAWAAPLEGAFVTGIDAVGDDLVVLTTLDHGIGLMRRERLILLDVADGLPFPSLWGARRVGETVLISGADGVIALAHAALLERFERDGRVLDWRVPVSISGTLRGSLRTRCCNGGARSRAVVDGARIWYPTLEGALALETDRLGDELDRPRARIEQFRTPDTAPTTVRAGEPVVVDGRRRDLSLVYTGFAYRDPAGLRFEYRLDGYDADWVAAGTRREAFYTNLPPGEYLFRVRAESAARISTMHDATLPVVVRAHWHERTGVRIAALAAAALLLGMLFQRMLRARTAKLRAREAQLQAQVAERTAELAHANEHLRAANRALVHENETDLLTGLANRRWAARNLEEWLARDAVAPDPGRCAVLVLFDLDRFRQMNERFGHAGGDLLLQHFGALLQRLAGRDAAVMRWGGEEFLVVLPAVPREAAAARVEQLWRDAVAHIHPAPDGRPIVLPTSAGFACWPVTPDGERGIPWTIALELADAAVFQVKRHARNAWAGLVATAAATAGDFEGGVSGRARALVDAGAITWVNIRPRPDRMTDDRPG